MTEEELNRLPNDGAEQHDFYIYGTPKQEIGLAVIKSANYIYDPP